MIFRDGAYVELSPEEEAAHEALRERLRIEQAARDAMPRPLPIEQRLAALEDRLAALEAARGP